MAFLPGIFNRQAAQAPAPTPAAPTAPAAAAPSAAGPAIKQQAPANPGADPATMSNIPAQPAAGGPITGLDNFKDLFAPKPVDPNAPKAPTLADPYLGTFDANVLRQQVAQANFAAGIPQEILQKAASGDMQALQEAINAGAREAFAAATQLSHGLVEHGARSAAERTSGMIDSRVRSTLIRSQNTDNATLSHPAVAPMFNMVKAQMAAANPQLSAEQVQSQSEAYFQQFADAFTAPTRAAEQAKAAPTAPNFAGYLE